MHTELLEKNLSELKIYHPDLYDKIRDISYPPYFIAITSKNGYPVLKIKDILIHSIYNPISEAERIVSEIGLSKDNDVAVYGLGFGYHIREIIRRTEGEITIIEPSYELFKFVLSCIDMTDLIRRCRFLVGMPADALIKYIDLSKTSIVSLKPYERLSERYINYILTAKKACEILNRLRLKISVINPIYGGSLPTARYAASALQIMGHDVDIINVERFYDSFKAMGEITPSKDDTNILQASFTNLLGEFVFSRIKYFKPDIVLAIAQAPIGKDVLSRLRQMDIPTAFWFVEDFRTLTYWREVAPHYDYFFTIQKGEFFKELADIGVRNVCYLPQACDTNIFKKVDLNSEDIAEFSSDISFMGAGYYNRQRFLKSLIDLDFKIWGTEWDILSPLWQKVQRNGKRIETEDIVKIYNATKVNINLHSSSYHEGINPHGDYINPRTFEIAACEGFQLIDYRSELYHNFDEGKEIVSFKSHEDIREKIVYYLAHEDERREIAVNARKRVISQHTFIHRMKEMLFFIVKSDIERFVDISREMTDIEKIIEEAGCNSELGIFLSRYKDNKRFSIKDIIEDIKQNSGDLTKPEAIFMMMGQFLTENG